MAVIVNQRTSFDAQMEHREWREQKQTQIAYAYDWFGFAVPFLAPMVPASLTFAAIYANYPALLEIPDWAGFIIGLIAAAAIEALGVLSIETFFDMRQYNATLKADEGKAPENWAGLIVGIYLVVVLWLVVVLKMNHNLVIWSLIPLAVLGFISSAIMVMRKQHGEREFGRKLSGQSVLDKLKGELDDALNLVKNLTGQIDQIKRQLTDALSDQTSAQMAVKEMTSRAELAEDLAAKLQLDNGQLASQIDQLNGQIERLNQELSSQKSGQSSVKVRPNTPKKSAKVKLSKDEILDKLPDIKTDNPKISQQALADMFGVSKGTIGNYLAELGIN